MKTKKVWKNTNSLHKCRNHTEVRLVNKHSLWSMITQNAHGGLVELRHPLLGPAVLTGCGEQHFLFGAEALE